MVDLSTGTTGKDGGPGETSEDALNFERVTGSAAADVIRGDAQGNVLDGGAGDDVLSGAGGSDTLNGGDGLDTVSYAERAAGAPVTVVLDGAANDGGVGEADNAADVENVLGGAGDDALTGNDGPNVLDGGPGADRLIGLAGADDFRAGAGDDAVDALDGNAEPVDCGDGAGDQVDADGADALTGCEVARVVAAPGGAPPTGAPPGASGSGAVVLERIRATIARLFRTRGDRTRITRLTVKQIPAGGTVLLTCKPPRGARAACPFRRFERTLAGGTRALRLRPRFEGRPLRAGTVVVLRVTAPSTIGRHMSWRVRDGKLPKERSRCLQPGAPAPSRCPR